MSEDAPAMVKKAGNMVSKLVPICLKMMTELDEEESWYTTNDVFFNSIY